MQSLSLQDIFVKIRRLYGKKKKEEMFIENDGGRESPLSHKGAVWVAALLLRTIPQSDVESQDLAVALDLQGDGVAHLACQPR